MPIARTPAPYINPSTLRNDLLYVPFDLDAALSGARVLLRNGRTATVGAFNPRVHRSRQVLGWDDFTGLPCAWSLAGHASMGQNESDIVCMFAPTVSHGVRTTNTTI